MAGNAVVRCRCGHLWTVHLEGVCSAEEGPCDCQGFYPSDWRRNTTKTCRGCGHGKSQHSGVSCQARVGEETLTETRTGFEGEVWTTKRTIGVLCSCESFW